MIANDSVSQNQMMQKYYVFQSSIYDATRWGFLFGRTQILDRFNLETPPSHIVEIGCGTGHNLLKLVRRFPDAKITGVDVSGDMLNKARKKLAAYPNVQLIEKPYGGDFNLADQAPDLMLFSYSLTMINPQWSDILTQAHKDLKKGGKIAVVDFHSSPVTWFRKHMENNHVRMEAHMDNQLNSSFTAEVYDIKKAYSGLWNYFLFVGKK